MGTNFSIFNSSDLHYLQSQPDRLQHRTRASRMTRYTYATVSTLDSAHDRLTGDGEHLALNDRVVTINAYCCFRLPPVKAVRYAL